ncbi:hypothetical protein DL98DRAFT_93468 [Cadophora sp. DSE1049]|nr:hypothetical protein DL98DRAFT_93468 [Cadophora sp. DSE1049]
MQSKWHGFIGWSGWATHVLYMGRQGEAIGSYRWVQIGFKVGLVSVHRMDSIKQMGHCVHAFRSVRSMAKAKQADIFDFPLNIQPQSTYVCVIRCDSRSRPERKERKTYTSCRCRCCRCVALSRWCWCWLGLGFGWVHSEGASVAWDLIWSGIHLGFLAVRYVPFVQFRFRSALVL